MELKAQDLPLSLDDAVAFTGYSKQYLYKLTSRGQIPHYRPNNGKLVFKRDELEAFMFRGKRAAAYELAATAEAMLLTSAS